MHPERAPGLVGMHRRHLPGPPDQRQDRVVGSGMQQMAHVMLRRTLARAVVQQVGQAEIRFQGEPDRPSPTGERPGDRIRDIGAEIIQAGG